MTPAPSPLSPGQRVPTPPEPVLRWVEAYGPGGDPGEDDPPRPGGAGVPALEVALGIAPTRREAAWALLAADALLTWSVEDAAEAADPEAELRALLQAVAQVDPGTGAR